MKKLGAAVIALVALTGCMDDASIATHNLTKAADNFEINRRVVFYNGITDTYMLSIEGRCSIDLNQTGTAFNVICKTGHSEFKRHTLVLSDNTTAFVEQLQPTSASAYYYRVTFKPEAILPDFNIRTKSNPDNK